MEVKLYTFAKKDNSTARPSGTGTAFACYLKDASGVLAPTIRLDPSIGNPRSYNYAYISDFARYYFIREWTYYRGEWEASLEVDALASWKTDIGSASEYVLRCSNSTYWNGYVIDNKYPMMTPVFNETVQLASNPWSGYSMVVGVIGDDGTGHPRGPVMYYALTGSQGEVLFNWLLGNTGGYIDDLGTLFTGVVDNVFKATYNPMQYIVSARVFPFTVTDDYESVNGVTVGKVLFGLTPGAGNIKKLTPEPIQILGPFSFDIPFHPQIEGSALITARGKFLASPPYSEYAIEIQPFGTIEIDGGMLVNCTTLSGIMAVDLITGETVLKLYADGTNRHVEVGEYHAVVGSTIALAQMSNNVVINTAGQVGKFAVSMLTDNYFGAAEAAIGTVTSMRYDLNREGCNETFLPYVYPPVLQFYYHRIVEEDDDHMGRPCCRLLNLGTVGGYMICAEGDISTAASQAERETIRSRLTSGFYYE